MSFGWYVYSKEFWFYGLCPLQDRGIVVIVGNAAQR
ncbi:MAG: hypothetical protein MAG794_00308 [Gammaproteobacteria bacterium]|nr:hypothetical protein [Gammaproteobacteria bacterium]